MTFKEWYNEHGVDFECMSMGCLGLIVFYIVLAIIIDGIPRAYNWSRLQLCYLTKRCVAVEFLGKKYTAKTTSEIDDKIVDYYNGEVAIFNVQSKIVHWDKNCKAAKLCTDNCIYMPEKVAEILVKDKVARPCNYERYTIENCERTCGDISSELEYYCVEECAYDTYNDEQFDKDRFLEDASKGAYDVEPPNTY